MTSDIEHARPVDSEGRVRVLFALEDSALGNAEALWATPLARDEVRLDNIPLLVFGVSMADVARIRDDEGTPRFAGIAERGGHSTYRVMVEDGEDPEAESRIRELVVLGCGYEQLTPRFFAFDVPPEVDVFKVYEMLERGLDDGAWTFEEGHCGHPGDGA